MEHGKTTRPLRVIQWILFITAIGLISYVPLARIYLFFNDQSWGGVPQSQNSTKDTSIKPEK
jgi:hypothetical protein